MRNLKKILALVMALVMSMSLVTIANAADFTDDSEISYKEAVDVMTAIGVIDGYDDGSFDPDGILTREEAATLITRMLLGDEADSLSSSSSSFADVDASRWSSPYIEYCVSLGIIAGAGDGNFYPAEQLTGYAFAKMLLIALGYDADREGYTGTSWTVNVASDATSAGIDQDGLMMSSGLSREGAAQMCLNTLEADMVSYSGSSSTTVSTGDGTSIVISGSAEEINNSESDDYRTDSEDSDDVQQFCEYYFEYLQKNEADTDEFGRPAVSWRYRSSTIGTYSEEADGSFIASAEKGELYDVIGRDVYNELVDSDSDVNLYVYVNGEDVSDYYDDEDEMIDAYFSRNEDDSAACTGRGVLTEVFVDDDTDDVTITHIFTYVAQVDGDYNESDGELDLDTLDGTDLDNASVGWGAYEGLPISVDDWTLYDEDFSSLSAYSDGDYVLVTVAEDEIQTVQPATVITGEVTAYTSTTSVTVDGTRYYYSKTFNDAVTGDGIEYNLNDEYMLVLDENDYVLYSDGADGVNSYVLLSRVARAGSISDDLEAYAYFLNGTVDTIDLDDDSEGTATIEGTEVGIYDYFNDADNSAVSRADIYTWYEYDEQSNGSYEVSDPENDRDMELIDSNSGMDEGDDIVASGSAYVYFGDSSSERIRVDNSTVFVIDDDDDVQVYTGVRNAPDITYQGTDVVVSWVMDDDGRYAEAVFIASDDMNVSGGSDDRVYILDTDYEHSVDTDDNDYYTYEAIVNGEITEVYAADNSTFNEIGLYHDISYNTYDYVNDAELVDESDNDGDDFRAYVDLEDVAIVYSNGVLSFGTLTDSGSLSSSAEDLVLADDYTVFNNDDGTGETITPSTLDRDFEDGGFYGHIYAFLDDNEEVAEVYVWYDEDTAATSDPSDPDDEETDTEAKTLTIDSSNVVGEDGEDGLVKSIWADDTELEGTAGRTSTTYTVPSDTTTVYFELNGVVASSSTDIHYYYFNGGVIASDSDGFIAIDMDDLTDGLDLEDAFLLGVATDEVTEMIQVTLGEGVDCDDAIPVDGDTYVPAGTTVNDLTGANLYVGDEDTVTFASATTGTDTLDSGDYVYSGAKVTFTLGDEDTDIYSLTVDGEDVSTGDYVVVGSTLTVRGTITSGYYIVMNDGEENELVGEPTDGNSRAELEYTVTEDDVANGLSIEASNV